MSVAFLSCPLAFKYVWSASVWLNKETVGGNVSDSAFFVGLRSLSSEVGCPPSEDSLQRVRDKRCDSYNNLSQVSGVENISVDISGMHFSTTE